MNHSNEGIWEPPLAGGKPRRLTHFTASRIFDFNWFFDHARLLLTRGNVNSDAVLLSNLTECIPFLDLAIRWARAVLGNSSCLVARCLLTPVRTVLPERSPPPDIRFATGVLKRLGSLFEGSLCKILSDAISSSSSVLTTRPWPNRCVPLK
jgi:hypothetical protein